MRANYQKEGGAFPAFWTLGADFTLDGKINGKQDMDGHVAVKSISWNY